ncbi:MAG: protein-glutamate O-methyltransferase CheR [Burkholderiales bacterium]|nr:protein-glutamate O-methyltransferase CheR [Burkholderiales bacterium]
MPSITQAEFGRFQRFIYDAAGITLSSAKQALVAGRLGKRLTHHQLDSYEAYFQLITSDQHADERQLALDLLTTHETYFFREIKHFEFLRAQALAARERGQPLRVWSAASSSGEEAYSMAMVLVDCLGDAPWEVLGTDISASMIANAARGLYSMERARHVPPDYLRRFCLKGTGPYAGRLLIDPQVRSRVRFARANLNEALPDLGLFDLVFLRNVMIYFNDETKRGVVSRVSATIKPGRHLCIGHSESLNHISGELEQVAASIYCKPA